MPHQLAPEQWVSNHADYLYNFAFSKVNDEELAKDLLQETFFAALKSAENFKGEASERTWLFSILKRKIIDHYRKSNSTKGKAEVKMNFVSEEETSEDWIEAKVAEKDLNAEDLLENEELGLAIENCINKLPEKQAKIFTMKTIDGISTEEICNEMNITPSNLWVMIHRARTGIMNCLDENWF